MHKSTKKRQKMRQKALQSHYAKLHATDNQQSLKDVATKIPENTVTGVVTVM